MAQYLLNIWKALDSFSHMSLSKESKVFFVFVVVFKNILQGDGFSSAA